MIDVKKLIALALVVAVLAGGLVGCENKPAGGGSKPAGGTPAATSSK